MKDREIEEQKESEKKDIEQLEILAFHFTQLSKRLSQDREHWAETGKELAQVVEKIDKTVQGFANFEQKLKEQVTLLLHDKSQDVAEKMAKTFDEIIDHTLKSQMTTTATHLNKVVYEAGRTLASYQQEFKSFKQWFLIGIVLSTFVSSLLIGSAIYYFLPILKTEEITQILEASHAMKETEKAGLLSQSPQSRNKIKK